MEQETTSRARRRGAGLALAVTLTGCASGQASPADPDRAGVPTARATAAPTAPAATPPATPPAPSTAPRVHRVRRLVVGPAVAAMPPTWREAFVVPYGPDEDQLGTSSGGDAGGPVTSGPEHGAPAPDGSWWFLDVGKERLAHYDSSGGFLEAVAVHPRLPGTGFDWQLPHVLADGTLVAFRLTADAGAMLRLRDGVLDELPLTAGFSPTYDDGTLLYDARTALDPGTGAVAPTDGYRLPSGAAFTLTDDVDHGTLELGTTTSSVTLPTVTTTGAVAHVGVQLRAGADGSIHLFLAGTGGDAPGQLVGYARVAPSGRVTRPEPLTDPFSATDPGGAAQLALVPGGSTPLLVYVAADGVHVYRRDGGEAHR